MDITELHEKWLIELKKGFTKPLILQTLAVGKTYPYHMTKLIHQQTNGVITIATSNLYPILKGLVEEGLVTSILDEQTRRTLYTLTPKGIELLQLLKTTIGIFTHDLSNVFQIK